MLRIRLVLWYTLLTVLTIIGVGIFQYFLLYGSLTEELDTSLEQDARATLRLLPTRTRPSAVIDSATRSKTIRELMDEALAGAPPTISSDELTDLVISAVIDEMLFELSEGKTLTADAVEAIVQRRRNNFVEIYLLDSANRSLEQATSIYRSSNLNSDTLRRLFGIDQLHQSDTARKLGEQDYETDVVRAAIAANERYAVIIAYPETDIRDTIFRLLTTYAFIVPIALIIAAIGGVILARKALQPIEEIADAAREISAKNLSHRISLPARTDHELMTLVATLNSMFSRLEVSYEQIAQFSSDASHELKTPLAIMKGEIERMNRKFAAEPDVSLAEVQDLLMSMMEEVDRMQRIVEGLLLIAKAEDRKLPLDKESANIYDFLAEICEDTAILASARGLAFESRLADEAKNTVIDFDRVKMYQVMMNLVDNALKYTSHGTIAIFLVRSGDAVQFGVEDTGPGIAPEDIPKVFQRFFRSESSRTPPEHGARSLGLGLAITKSIVEAHGGTITVSSKLGEGTKFKVHLPLQPS